MGSQGVLLTVLLITVATCGELKLLLPLFKAPLNIIVRSICYSGHCCPVFIQSQSSVSPSSLQMSFNLSAMRKPAVRAAFVPTPCVLGVQTWYVIFQKTISILAHRNYKVLVLCLAGGNNELTRVSYIEDSMHTKRNYAIWHHIIRRIYKASNCVCS